jgi:hypothetical protein
MPESVVLSMSPTLAGVGQHAPLHHVAMASDPLYCAGSSFCLRLCIYPYQEVLCFVSFPFLAHWQRLLLSILYQFTFSLPLIPSCLFQLPATSENSKLFGSVQTHHRSVIGLDRVYGPNIRKSGWLRVCQVISQPVAVCRDSISVSGTAITLPEVVTARVNEVLVVGDGRESGADAS